jgi:K+-sensing histidine kinase KdpD
MGLAICRSIIETDQGRLWLALRQVPGVTVGFTIPLQPKTENDSR